MSPPGSPERQGTGTAVAAGGWTRRDLALRGLIGAGGALAVSATPWPEAALAVAGDDAAILESAIAAEQAAALAYVTGHESGLLERPVREIAKLFGEQESEHIDALARALRALGGTVPDPPVLTDVEGLGAMRTQTDFL
ncbi:MAG: ferritin-like domain-containing protein, partial [Solirubrobacterales bacterium]